MAKTAPFRKKEETLEIPSERRWTVVSGETGRRIYLPSKNGLDRSGAEALADRLAAEVRVVPEGALRAGKFQPELLERAIEVAEREEE